MQASSYREEIPINSLNFNDLILQFKLMRALGYQSLFDADFRREIRNPFRKMLYYKLILAEEGLSSHMNSNILKEVADRVGFYTNPSLYKDIKQKEIDNAIRDDNNEPSEEDRKRHDQVIKDHVPMDPKLLEKTK
jgi:hypothetical protein